MAGPSRRNGMAPAQIPVFLSQKSSNENGQFCVVGLRLPWYCFCLCLLCGLFYKLYNFVVLLPGGGTEIIGPRTGLRCKKQLYSYCLLLSTLRMKLQPGFSSLGSEDLSRWIGTNPRDWMDFGFIPGHSLRLRHYCIKYPHLWCGFTAP